MELGEKLAVIESDCASIRKQLKKGLDAKGSLLPIDQKNLLQARMALSNYVLNNPQTPDAKEVDCLGKLKHGDSSPDHITSVIASTHALLSSQWNGLFITSYGTIHSLLKVYERREGLQTKPQRNKADYNALILANTTLVMFDLLAFKNPNGSRNNSKQRNLVVKMAFGRRFSQTVKLAKEESGIANEYQEDAVSAAQLINRLYSDFQQSSYRIPSPNEAVREYPRDLVAKTLSTYLASTPI